MAEGEELSIDDGEDWNFATANPARTPSPGQHHPAPQESKRDPRRDGIIWPTTNPAIPCLWVPNPPPRLHVRVPRDVDQNTRGLRVIPEPTKVHGTQVSSEENDLYTSGAIKATTANRPELPYRMVPRDNNPTSYEDQTRQQAELFPSTDMKPFRDLDQRKQQPRDEPLRDALPNAPLLQQTDVVTPAVGRDPKVKKQHRVQLRLPDIRLSFITAQDQARFEAIFVSAVQPGWKTMSKHRAMKMMEGSKVDLKSISDICRLADTTNSRRIY
ncbi:hypothetical protein N658DRAFT_332564 [Parathielavia hyrcaniae]|uniref:Uncharacterized protein n=1 Tax=Parathielavia hyrcaniae TaxID=113614 RepID=A0AAN6PTK7_9PEZI|nr:hypothetical protein N658DRAFT_332564 [Parathielavia hyrcaniae]